MLIFNKRDSKIVGLMGFRFSVFEICGDEISGDLLDWDHDHMSS